MILNVVWTEALRSLLRGGRPAGQETPAAGPAVPEVPALAYRGKTTAEPGSSLRGEGTALRIAAGWLPASEEVAVFHGGAAFCIAAERRRRKKDLRRPRSHRDGALEFVGVLLRIVLRLVGAEEAGPLFAGRRRSWPRIPGILTSSACSRGEPLACTLCWVGEGETLSWGDPNNWLALPTATKEEPPQAGEPAAAAEGAGDGTASAGGEESRKAA
jgi:hypothetical protein